MYDYLTWVVDILVLASVIKVITIISRIAIVLCDYMRFIPRP